jgi:hypothetical protein
VLQLCIRPKPKAGEVGQRFVWLHRDCLIAMGNVFIAMKTDDDGQAEPDEWARVGPCRKVDAAQPLRWILGSDVSQGKRAQRMPHAGR